MNQWGWIIAGAAAMTGTFSMCWSYVKSFWTYMKSHVIVTCQVQGDLEEALSMYCWTHFKCSPFGIRNYVGWTIFVRPVKRVQLITMEFIGKKGKLFWRGWRPIWTKRSGPYEGSDIVMKDRRFEGGLTMSFLRGTFNLDQLLIQATNEYNSVQAAGENQTRSRYFVRHIFGTDGKMGRKEDDGCVVSNDSNGQLTATTSLQNRILQWEPDDLGVCRLNHGNAVDQLALSPEGNKMVDEIKRWKTSENWYKDRGIPWRRGWLLYGPGGTGKTSLVRAVAEDLDLPIFVYHLSTLYDDELQKAWQRMQMAVPCVALIEDIDTNFDGRTNITGGHLTFDCLLNCIDGVERTGGILLAVTTNQLDKVDAALGIPTAEKTSTRPGRLDRVLEMHLLDDAGREKLCRRILAEWPETWPELIAAGVNETGAQFESRCTQKAIELFWN
jgi:hypothetical protein